MFEDPTSDACVTVVNVDRIHADLTEQQRPCHLQWFDKGSATALMVDVHLMSMFA
jgi:hypothetical protein